MQGAGSNQSLGEMGESIAVTFLKGAGFTIVERNFTCVCGELDIIAREGRTIVFVEVKCRRNRIFGPPQLAVTPFKQRQISKAALVWLSKKKLYDAEARFDVVAIVLRKDDLPEIEHVRNAFDLAFE
ncbi:YraN family protein [Geomonas sp. RF6]|uniref:YraN family protein n=1 Tax=Geomonas sp. RF6 TaxID=2897342 RepID=UPI001E577D30|nr:YraN family protein [Geomonas sp. RF6]UFS72724.1 YraN family protein [Geomonas sp. RF6]